MLFPHLTMQSIVSVWQPLFPYHDFSTLAVLTSHHFTYFTLAALLVCAWVHDGWKGEDPTDPYFVEFGCLFALFSFLFVWGGNKPALGAIFTMVCLVVATFGVVFRDVWWTTYYPRPLLAVLVCLAAAWDDVLQHAFGWPMPLDWAWKHGVSNLVYGLDNAIQQSVILL